MNKKFDAQRVEAALKRAGKTAVTGSKLERSGRFLSNASVKKTGSAPMENPEISNKRK
jgi:hypothetical protein